MKNLLILYPHFPPSNLAGVHRPRLFAQHLKSFGWLPIVLTVHEKYYEELPDWNLVKLIPENLRIEKVSAFPLSKPRFIGDIGLRAFFQLYIRAKKLIQMEKIDFLLIPIPSFYCALLGRWLNHSTGVKYGIDYIDPWVHEFPGSNKWFSRHWVSSQIAKFLEPIAVKNSSLITGVDEGYYIDVFKRNPHLKSTAVCGAMPYGGEKTDHALLNQMDLKPYLFKKKNKLILVYAGAMLPKAYGPLEAIFKSIQASPEIFQEIEFYFIGTGKTTNDPNGYNIKPLAEQYGLWETTVFEYPKRIPYLDVLVHLNATDGVFILGSTEPHYTPSKVYQAILSKKPVLAVLHNQSSAVTVLRKSRGGIVLGFDGADDVLSINNNFAALTKEFLEWIKDFDVKNIQQEVFEKYTAKSITQTLTELLNKAVK